MSIYAPLNGKLKKAVLKLTTTDLTDLYEVPSSMRAALDSMTICNISGTDDTFSVAYYDGTSTVYMFKDQTITANETYILTNHNPPLNEAYKIQVQAGTADRIDVVGVFLEMSN